MRDTLTTFWSLLWYRKSRLFLYLPLFLLALSCMQLQPFLFKFIVDFSEAGNMNAVQQWAILYIVLLAVGHSIENIEHYILGLYLGKVQDDVMQKVMSSLRKMDHIFHTSKSSGRLISIVKRGDGSLYSFGWTILNSVGGVIIQTLIALGTFWILAPTAFYILVMSIGILSAAMPLLFQKNLKRRRELATTEDNLSAATVDSMVAFENIKLFGKEDYERTRVDELLSNRYTAGAKYLITFQYINYTFVIVMILAIAAIVMFSLQDMRTGNMSTGTFILVLTFITKNFYSLWEVIYNLRNILKSYADIKTYFDLIDLAPEITESAKAVSPSYIKGDINIENISFQYSTNDNAVLRNISLKIDQGETIALVGKSGGGKTTLAKLLMRFYDVTTGRIQIGGYDIRDLSFASLRKIIGIVPQDPVLFNNTIGYNIAYASPESSIEDVRNAAKKASLDDFIESLPNGYETIVGERGIKLSGGQRQRLAIARAFIHNPTIIIFDEATSQLDSENESLIARAMDELRANKTMIIIAHRLSTIMHADRIAVFDDGIISEVGTHQELLNTHSSIYHKLWNMQTNGLIQ